MVSRRTLLRWALLYRLLNALLVQTYFVPDEYWQTLEPAHHYAFGYGYLTWEWHEGLRSSLFPFVFVALYKALALFHLDSPVSMVCGPKLVQALFAAVADVALFRLARQLYGEPVAMCTLFVYYLNWFGWFCAPRTLLNTVEANLIVVAFSLYPWTAKEREKPPRQLTFSPYLALFALVTMVRPPSVILWLPLFLAELATCESKSDFIMRKVLPSTLVKPFMYSLPYLTFRLPVVFTGLLADRLFYGRWVLSLWNFFAFNVLNGNNAFFGTQPWYWYVTDGLTVVLLSHTVPLSLGVVKCQDRRLFFIASAYVVAHSFIAHKEHRFLLPVVPLTMVYAGFALYQIYRRSSGDSRRRAPFSLFALRHGKTAVWLVVLLSISHVPSALYAGLLHQRGPMDLMNYVHRLASARSARTSASRFSFWFLMPCHSTPFYSHVHLPTVDMRFLTCAPNVNDSETWTDEADDFHDDPESWLLDGPFDSDNSADWPSCVACYGRTWLKVRSLFLDRGYRFVKRLFNTHFPQSIRQSRYFIVACLDEA